MSWPEIFLTLQQLAVILLVTFLFGRLARLLRQPTVIGEIAGGLVLGPLALGRLFPALYRHLFPASHLHPLEVLSSIGLVLFLFHAGTEVDLNAVRRNRGAALGIPVGNIGLPFLLGALFSIGLYANFSPPNVPRVGSLLFIGIAMSITALPVLARIIAERGKTRFALPPEVSSTVLLCSAADDLVAWSLLALALALTNRRPGLSLPMTGVRLLVLLGYIAFMVQVVRPLAKKLIFFAKRRPPTGLRTQTGSLPHNRLGWFVALLVLAVFGKIFGSMIPARLAGMRWRSALEIGILMNTRGLVELIALNIGLKEHVLTPQLFTMFVLMAVLTTAMTVPLLDLTQVVSARRGRATAMAKLRLSP